MTDALQSRRLVSTGWAFYQAGNSAGALRDFREALAINPEDTEALCGAITCLVALKRLGEANEAADRLLRLAPNMARAHRTKGEVLRQSRKPRQAEGFFRISIRLDPDDLLGYHFLAVTQYQRKRYRAALKTVREGRRLGPWYGVLAAQEALILLHLKGPRAAGPLAEEALRLSGDDDYVLTCVARVSLMQGNRQKARDLLETVLRRSANNEEAISLFLLTERNRYGLLRAHVQFPYWRKDNGVFGWVVWIGAWVLLLAALIVVALAGRVPAFFVALAYQLFWRVQYSGHRRRVRAHFAQTQLKPGF